MFSGLYENLLKIYPSIQLPEKPIYNYILERYYIETGKTISGTSFNIAPDMVIVKANEVENLEHVQYIHNNSLIEVFIIPYNIDRYSFNGIEGYSIIYNIVFDICTKYEKYGIFSPGLKKIFKYAPFVISTVLYNELFSININSGFEDILNILEPDLDISLDLMYEVIQHSIEDLLEKGKIIPILEQEEERRKKTTEEVYKIDLSKIQKDEKYEGII